jgi:hypothetical protein
MFGGNSNHVRRTTVVISVSPPIAQTQGTMDHSFKDWCLGHVRDSSWPKAIMTASLCGTPSREFLRNPVQSSPKASSRPIRCRISRINACAAVTWRLVNTGSVAWPRWLDGSLTSLVSTPANPHTIDVQWQNIQQKAAEGSADLIGARPYWAHRYNRALHR